MNYLNGSEIVVGDRVLVEGDMKGVVVCDFDNWKCLAGYERFLTKEELVGGGYLSSGVMIETSDIGIVHYPEPDSGILLVARVEKGSQPQLE